jgi:hypothetical protein
METWGAGFHYNTADQWYININYDHWVTWRGATYYFNRNFPDQSRICSQFWRKNVPYNSYSSLGIACATIHG